jgi:3-dehydroquinate dehydratase-2
MRTILVVNGPNLNMLGTRQPEIYGRTTLADIEAAVQERATQHGFEAICVQSNHEGVLVDRLQQEGRAAAGVVINAGAFTHYSYAIRDALAMLPCPVIEVHLSNVEEREEWRRESVIKDLVAQRFIGEGPDGYRLALEYLKENQ